MTTQQPQLSLMATTTDGLNVRCGPGIDPDTKSHYLKVGLITAGSDDRYDILGKDAATAGWYRIRFSNSIIGWVQASCVRLHGDGRNLPVAGTQPAPVGPQLNLKSSVTAGLNLRTGPGTTHRILLTLSAGATRYGILGKDADTAGWYEIRYGGTVTGWVSAPYVQTHGSLVCPSVEPTRRGGDTSCPRRRKPKAGDPHISGSSAAYCIPSEHRQAILGVPAVLTLLALSNTHTSITDKRKAINWRLTCREAASSA